MPKVPTSPPNRVDISVINSIFIYSTRQDLARAKIPRRSILKKHTYDTPMTSTVSQPSATSRELEFHVHPSNDNPRPSLANSNENRMPLLCVTVAFCCIFAAVFVVLRFYARKSVMRTYLGADDWLILAGIICLWVQGGFAIYAGTEDFTDRTWDIDILRRWQLLRPLQASYLFAALFVQLSVISLCLRLASPIRAYTIIGGFLTTLCIALTIVRLVIVWAIKDSVWYYSSLISFLLDLLVWCMPLTLIWLLRGIQNSANNTIRRKKFHVTATFAVGLLVCSVAAARLFACPLKRGDPPHANAWDRVYYTIFDQLEVGLGIVCACMPPMRVLRVPRYGRRECGKAGINLKWLYKTNSEGDERRNRARRKRIGPEHDHQPGHSGWGIQIVREQERTNFESKFGDIVIERGPSGHIELDIEGFGVLDRPPALTHNQRPATAPTHPISNSNQIAFFEPAQLQPPRPSLTSFRPSSTSRRHFQSSSIRTLTTNTGEASTPTVLITPPLRPPPSHIRDSVPSSASTISSVHRVSARLSQIFNPRSPKSPLSSHGHQLLSGRSSSEEHIALIRPPTASGRTGGRVEGDTEEQL